MRDLLCAIDCGTQSLRLIVFDPDGRAEASHRIEYEPYHAPQPGWAEQDPEVFWRALCNAGRRVFRSARLRDRVAAVGVTTQRDTMICMDQKGQALRPAITWLDTRKDPGFYRPGPAMRVLYGLAGMADTMAKTMADGKVNWIRHNEPRVWEKTWKYVQVSGFLNYRLSGEVADSVSSIVGHVPMDYRHRRWASPRDLASRVFPVDREKLYTLMEPGARIGEITAAAAKATGLPPGIPLIACGADKACETLGLGVVDRDVASLSFGTTATVEVMSPRYFEPMPFIPAYCAARPGYFNPEIEVLRGYWMISWFKRQMGFQETEEARRSGGIPEDLLDRLLEESPPGNRGLLLQPFWGPGLLRPHARGAIIGFGDCHDRAAVYRAIVEGLAYSLREGVESLERRGGVKIRSAAASGGASRNSRICQITADVLGKSLVRGATPETSALGAALISAVGVGIHSGFDEAIERMVQPGDEFHPNREVRSLYDDLYDVYRSVFPSMDRIYRKLRSITGYPEITPPNVAAP